MSKILTNFKLTFIFLTLNFGFLQLVSSQQSNNDDDDDDDDDDYEEEEAQKH